MGGSGCPRLIPQGNLGSDTSGARQDRPLTREAVGPVEHQAQKRTRDLVRALHVNPKCTGNTRERRIVKQKKITKRMQDVGTWFLPLTQLLPQVAAGGKEGWVKRRFWTERLSITLGAVPTCPQVGATRRGSKRERQGPREQGL